MTTNDIELRSAVMGVITDVWDRAKQIDDAADEVLDLIEADRKRRQSEAEEVCAEAYQVVGSLLSDLGIFETEHAKKILDNLSQARMVHKDVLPWPSFDHKRRGEPVAALDLLRRANLVLKLVGKDSGSTICTGGLVHDITTYLAAPQPAETSRGEPVLDRADLAFILDELRQASLYRAANLVADALSGTKIAPQPAEPSIKKQINDEWAEKLTAAQPAETDYKALFFKEQALRMEAEACLDMVSGDEPVKVPSDDALDDALSNLAHDNYELSYSGYKNRQADIALIRAALARYGRD